MLNVSKNYPKISVITPSYNQGQFIKETIISVIGQLYPNLEYIIIDGASTDNTVEVIKEFKSQINYWVSEPDSGQSEAINKGFKKSTGEILCWLNSDDLFMPGALFVMAEKYITNRTQIYFGNSIHFKTKNKGIESFGSDVYNATKTYSLLNGDFVIQPSSFWSKETWLKVGELKEDVHFGFDWEWFLRSHKLNIPFAPITECLSLYRIHDNHKTGIGGKNRQHELLSIYKQYSEKYARLYELIINESINYLRIDIRIIKKLFSIINKPNGKADILKLLKSSKYKEFTSAEIEECLGMS